jgi:ribosomal protein L13|tara:strand:+ start:401 stop:553 length:153 start_codon:yes stop_codon:yes gene_type:complete
MNKTFKQFVEGMLPKTEKGINNAMKKGLDKLDQKYQKEYDDMKYPLDKKA